MLIIALVTISWYDGSSTLLSLSAFGEEGEAAFGEGDLGTFLGDFLGETDFFFAVTAFAEASFLTTVFFVGDFAALDEALAILYESFWRASEKRRDQKS